VILLGALFVLSFAASAFAIHAEIPSDTQAVVAKSATQITIGGDLRTRGWFTSNIDGTSKLPTDAGDASWYDERVRLSVDAKISPNVEGMIELESGSGRDYTYTWGNFGAKPAANFGFLQAWIMYSGSGLFGFPAGVKVGHMPLYLGNKTFFDHSQFGDDAIVGFLLPTKELEVDLLTIKFAEGSKYVQTDDLDGYVGIVSYKLDDKNTLGVNYTYLNQSNADFSHQNVELVANGNIAGFGYAVSGDIQFGDLGEASNGDKIKAEGWAAQAKFNYMMDPVNIRLAGAYGSGDNNPTDNKDKEFITYLNNDPNYTLVYDYSVTTACSAASVHTGLCNTTYVNLGVDADLMKDLKASLDGYYLRASKAEGSKNIGWEIDAKIIYNLAKNLVYRVDAGWLDTGNFYKDNYNVQDTKNATVLRHLIELSF
jgi:hypothetical protein